MVLERLTVRVSAACCVGALLLWSASADAASLHWTALPECPSETEVTARLERERGGPISEGPAVQFDATVTETSSGLLTLTVYMKTKAEDGGETRLVRSLSAPQCEQLVAALSQIVSLALGPISPQAPKQPPTEQGNPTRKHDLVAEALEATTGEASPKPSSRARSPRAGTEPRDATFNGQELPSTSSEREALHSLALLGVVDMSSFGEFAFGPFVEVGWRLNPRFELQALLGYFPPQIVERSDGAGARFSLALGGAAACFDLTKTPWYAPICLGMELGHWSAEGVSVENPESDTVLWLAARAEARFGFDLAPAIRVGLRSQFLFPLLPHRFVLSGTALHQIPRFGYRLGLGTTFSL